MPTLSLPGVGLTGEKVDCYQTRHDLVPPVLESPVPQPGVPELDEMVTKSTASIVK